MNRRRTFLALTIVISLAAATLTALPAEAAPAKAPALWNVKPVSGTHAGKVAARATPASSKSVAIPRISSVTTGSFSGALPPGTAVDSAVGRITGSWTKVGSTGVQVAAAEPGNAEPILRAAPPHAASVDASVLSAADAKKYGLKGLVIQLRRVDGGTSPAPVAVRVPNSLLGARFGGDYASRLRWVAVIPAGSSSPSNIATPEVFRAKLKHAMTTDVANTQDTSSKSTVLMPQVSGTKMFLVASGTPTASDGTGNFAATPLKSSSSWDVSAQTGDFAWSYDMRVPPAAAGPAPAVALQYDSQSVDGESGSTNNQPSAIGEGWSEGGGGYIERSYIPCSLDNGSSGPVTEPVKLFV